MIHRRKSRKMRINLQNVNSCIFLEDFLENGKKLAQQGRPRRLDFCARLWISQHFHYVKVFFFTSSLQNLHSSASKTLGIKGNCCVLLTSVGTTFYRCFEWRHPVALGQKGSGHQKFLARLHRFIHIFLEKYWKALMYLKVNVHHK